MGRYLEIADRALDEITENQTVKESESNGDPSTQCEISEISELSPVLQSVDRLSMEFRENLDELKPAAGDDWDEISNDPAQLVAFADSLAIVQIRESGGVPDTYVSVTTCQNCGEVPIYEGCPLEVGACPWCMSGFTAPRIPGVKE